MALARPARIGVVALVLSGIVVGSVALASGARQGDSTQASTAADAASTAVQESEPRETPATTASPVDVDPAVQAQLSYALTYWSDYNTDEYGVVDGNDCVNFTSQSLVARGWAMDEDWWTSGTGSDFDFSSPWVSSTAFMNYIADSGRATALTDDQRDQVKLGDVVQFDWDNSGDRDHTAVVSRIEGSGDDIEIFYAGHTDDTDYLSVDFAITEKHPGGTAYYWSIP
ncbi:amidase domain-containing protein [Cryobacterium sp. PAMC25264]|uniref:amidase domain-containing protein n=1 Tax=Cryobacterium sp. PAMC25264 TaxID=2861288 RepID=UPI001C632CA9|nr:amidase domain-containing protein [Cryobacterium sp. PAMC25264]QYF73494.1 amidase domain-containing protein [Cryobacterium sp. PAMC25264]